MSTVDELHDEGRCPSLRQAHCHEVMRRAGETLFIPCGSWHIARCVTMNIPVAFDQLESTNWHESVGDVVAEERRNGHPVRAIGLHADSGLLDVAEWFGANRGADWVWVNDVVENATDRCSAGAALDRYDRNEIMNTEQSFVSDIPIVHANDATSWVVRRSGLGYDEFAAEYRDPRKPVVLGDAARAWPLYGRGTPDYFRASYGGHVVRVRGKDYRLRELIDLLETSTLEKPGPYPCKFEIAKNFRELLPEVMPRFAYSLPDRQANPLVPQRLFEAVNNLEIFFGGPGGEFPYLHYDVMRLHAWITQLHGDKEFTLYAPDQEHLLYVNPEVPWQSSIRDHHHPDYARYPLFREAKCQKVVIHAGETLFLPCGWWHTARSLNMTISVAFDQLGPDNWPDFIGDVVGDRRRAGHPLKAFALAAYLRALKPLFTLVEAMGVNKPLDWGAR